MSLLRMHVLGQLLKCLFFNTLVASARSRYCQAKWSERVSTMATKSSGRDAGKSSCARDCECKEGMFVLAATRRQLFRSTGLVAAVGMTAMLPRRADAKPPPGSVEYPVAIDSTKEPGRMMGEDGGYGSRSQFENETRWVDPTRAASLCP